MAVFTHTPEKSEHVRLFRYDDQSKVLSVTFDNGKVPEPKTYHYAGVPLEVFHSWLKYCADGHSAGSYFHRFVKNYKRVEDQVS